MENPFVSVLIASYNHEKFAKEAVESVLNQTYKNFELIIINDCSTDNTKKVIQSIHDPRIKFYSNKTNLGFMKTRNLLLKKAKGELIAFHDTDDVWLPEKLEKQINIMKNDPSISACFTAASIINEHGTIYTEQSECDAPLDLYKQQKKSMSEIAKHFFYKGNFLSHSSVLIKKNIIDKLGDFDVRYLQLQDFDYWCRLVSQYNIYITSDILMYVRRASHGHTGLSSNTDTNSIRLINESINIIYNFVNNLSKERFIYLFNNELLHKIESDNDLLAEKYLLLLKWKCMGEINKLPAFWFINNNWSKELQQILTIKYNYTICDFHSDNAKAIAIYPQTIDPNLKHLWKAIEEYRYNLEQTNNIIDDMTNSKSWKITKPLRMINRCFTKH